MIISLIAAVSSNGVIGKSGGGIQLSELTVALAKFNSLEDLENWLNAPNNPNLLPRIHHCAEPLRH